MSFDYAAMETGVAELVRAKLGLAETAVRWADQNLPEPDTAVRTWVSLRRADLVPFGGHGGVLQLSTSGSPSGQEVTLSTQEALDFVLSIQAYARGDANKRGGTTGNASATAALSRLSALLQLPSSLAQLKALGVGLNKVGSVRNLNALVDERIQGRALLELQMNLVESASETTTYIQTVQGGLTLTDASGDLPSIPFESAT